MLLRPLLADVLAELAHPQVLDEFRAEEDADQHRRHAGDQDFAHQAVSSSSGSSLGDRLEAGRARALDQDRVAGLELGREQLRRLGRVGDQLVGVVVAGRHADPDQQVDAGGAGVLADLAVVAGGAGAELAHLAQHRDRARRPEGGEVVERRAHRDRVGVVAVVHEDDPVAELEALAAEAGEAYVRGAVGHLAPAARRARRRPRPRPARWSGCAPRRRGSGSAGSPGRGRDQRLGHALGDPALRPRRRRRRGRSAAAAAPAPGAAPARPPRPGRSPMPVRAAAPSSTSALAAAIASTEPSSSTWTGPTLVITATSGSAISRQLGDLAGAAHRHLEHQRSRCRRAPRAPSAAARSRC